VEKSGEKLLRGKFDHSLDTKGRMSVPRRFHEILTCDGTMRLVVTNAVVEGVRYLDVYPLREWEKLERMISKLSQIAPKIQSFQRYYLSSAIDTEVDSQGRLLIPTNLREYAGFDKEVILVGMLYKMEIWSRDSWEKVFRQAEESFESTLGEIRAVQG